MTRHPPTTPAEAAMTVDDALATIRAIIATWPSANGAISNTLTSLASSERAAGRGEGAQEAAREAAGIAAAVRDEFKPGGPLAKALDRVIGQIARRWEFS